MRSARSRRAAALASLLFPLGATLAQADDALIGRWSGQMTCGATPVTFEVAIGREGDRLVASETWQTDRSSGSISYVVQASPSGQYSFLPRAVPGVPRGEWRSFTFLMQPSGNGRLASVDDRRSRCAQRVMTRAADGTAGRSPRDDAVVGTWQGTLHCGRGGAGDEAFLTVDGGVGGRLSARFVSFGPRHLESGPARMALVGEWVDGGTALRFAPVERQSFGMRFTGARASLVGERLTITLDGGNCRPIEAVRASEMRRRPTRSAQPGDGVVLRGSSVRAQCEALHAWPARLRREFPGLSFDNISSTDARLALPFGDDVFVPAFGRPFDAMSDAEKMAVSRQLVQDCRRDPLLAQSLRDLSGLLRGLSPVVLTSFGSISITYVVETQREVRHDLAGLARLAADVEAGRQGFSEAALSQVERSRALVRRHKTILWPSESVQAETAVAALESRLFDLGARDELRRLQAMTDPAARLQALAEIAAGRATWFQRASAAFRAETGPIVVRDHEAVSRAILAPYEAAVARAVRTLEGARDLDRMLVPSLPHMPHLTQRVRESFVASVEAWRDDMLAREMRPHLERLEATGQGAQGLRQAAEQRAAFGQIFEPYKTAPPVVLAFAAYEADRRSRLRTALEAFSQDIAALHAAARANPIEVKAVAERYLTEPSDWRRPIALAYRMAAARLGTPIPD